MDSEKCKELLNKKYGIEKMELCEQEEQILKSAKVNGILLTYIATYVSMKV